MNWKEIGIWIILTGLALLFCWLGGLIFLFLLPLPLAFLLNRQDNKSFGIAAVLLAGLLLLIYAVKWINLTEILLLAGHIIGLGWLLGWLLKQQKNFALEIFAAAAAGFNLLMVGLAYWVLLPQEFAVWLQELTVYLHHSLSGYAEITQGQLPKQVLTEMIQGILNLLSAMVMIYSLLLGIISWKLAYRGLTNWKIPVIRRPEFSRWHLPWPSIWMLIPGLACYLIGRQFEQNILLVLGSNWLCVCGFVFGIAGLACLIYLNGKWRFPIFLKILLIIFLLINGLFMILLPIMGVLDSLLDWRHKFESKGE